MALYLVNNKKYTNNFDNMYNVYTYCFISNFLYMYNKTDFYISSEIKIR